MGEEFQERRRTPRIAAGGAQTFRFARRVRIRVVDVSATGALLASEEPLPVGLTGRLQLSLGGVRFEGEVQIVRDQRAGAAGGHLLGSSVTPSAPRHQEALDVFLRRAGN